MTPPRASATRIALVTPSYGPDFERCRLLTESTARCAPPGMKHYVIVDRRDERMFRPLARGPVEVRTVESVLPAWIMRVPGAKRWWLSLRTMPIRNWVLQQLVKLSVPAAVDADVLVYCDSDVTFLRPIPPERFVRGDGLVRMQRVPFQGPEHLKWLKTARAMLALPADREYPFVNYVGSLISWRTDVVLRLHEHLRRAHGTHWIRTFCRHWDVSEYMLYGSFVENVLGFERAGHFADSSAPVHLCWPYKLDTVEQFQHFLAGAPVDSFGIMVHSKFDVPLDRYRPLVEREWARAAAPAASGPAA